MKISLYEINSELDKILSEVSETGELTEKQAELIESLNLSLEDKHRNYGLYLLKLDDGLNSLDAEIKRLTALKSQVSKRKQDLKNRLQDSMERNGLTKIEFLNLKLGFKKSIETDIYDESVLPMEYMVQKLVPNKTKIKKDIQAGLVVEGARLVEKNNLQIK